MPEPGVGNEPEGVSLERKHRGWWAWLPIGIPQMPYKASNNLGSTHMAVVFLMLSLRMGWEKDIHPPMYASTDWSVHMDVFATVDRQSDAAPFRNPHFCEDCPVNTNNYGFNHSFGGAE